MHCNKNITMALHTCRYIAIICPCAQAKTNGLTIPYPETTIHLPTDSLSPTVFTRTRLLTSLTITRPDTPCHTRQESPSGMKKNLWAALITIMLLPGPATAQNNDAAIIAAREAVRTGDRVTLERIAAENPPHILAPYVQYWLLLNKLARPDPPPVTDIADFLTAHADSLLAERLRGDWLRRLAKDKDWSHFTAIYQDLKNPDEELTCLNWTALLANNDRSPLTTVRQNWLDLVDSHPACTPVLAAATQADQIDSNQIWWRFRRQMEGGSPNNAKLTLSWLPAKEAPAKPVLDQIIRSPQRYLDTLPANFSVTRSGREMAMAAIIRLARNDIDKAFRHFSRLQEHFDKTERNYVYAGLALRAALAQRPEALAWFQAAGTTPMTGEQRAWHVRSALRAGKWQAVRNAIASMPAEEQTDPAWTYWLARAYAAENHPADAHALYTRIASEPHFYGLLAAEELGRTFSLPSNKTQVSNADRLRAKNDPSLNRAIALFALDMRTEAIREWNWGLRGQDEAFMLAAANLALEQGIYDRAINTAERGPGNANFELRFLAPFRPQVEPHAHAQGVDLSWVYGIMRQESRFIIPARSSSGAQGLMQVMPATGKWVAKKIGWTQYNPAQIADPEINIQLGTNYMRIILEGLDDHPVLASAGYNAGPGRARRWQDTQPLEGAIYAETIPFNETRDYVKKVMANTAIYAALFEGKPQSIKARLSVIGPKPVK